jgi:hypothetical protein
MRFKNWPSADSLRELRLVVFEAVPTDSAGIILTLLAGRAAAYPPIGTKFPTYIDSLPYEFTTTVGTNLQVKSYAYVAVVQQFGPNILADWRPVGVFSTDPGSFAPAPVRVILHHIIQGVDIQVDFQNPPPRPWR